MKSLPAEESGYATKKHKDGFFRRLKNLIKQFKRDLREPLPESRGKKLPARIVARFRHLFRRYGWKLVIVIFCYYLIRDSLLYIIIPYLIARQIIG